MKKLLCESLEEYKMLLEAEGDATKSKHPAKTLKDMLSMPYDQFISTLKANAADPKIDRVMNLGRKDGIPTDEIVKVTAAKYPVYKLRPTQIQIGLADSLGWLAKNKPEDAAKLIAGDTSGFDNARILTANGVYILDGHHRWSQVMMFNPKAEIPAINLDIPGFKNPTQLLKIVQLAIAATYQAVPGSGADLATDIFDDNKMSEKQIRQALPGLLGDQMTEICRAAYSKKYGKPLTKDDVYNIMTKNAMYIKKFKPAFGAPPRSEMPQPGDAAKAAGKDEKGVAGVPTDFVAKLKSGQLNYKKPLISNQSNSQQSNSQSNSQQNKINSPKE